MTVHNLSRPHHIVRLHKDGEIINVVRGTALMYDSASNDYFIKNGDYIFIQPMSGTPGKSLS
ncbi:MAG: hypothetical protein Q8941_24550 [Bacteroidota bacterium]|nr:hypothetical protein [Bacteroidota bacterium]